jgi:hypothetical protein
MMRRKHAQAKLLAALRSVYPARRARIKRAALSAAEGRAIFD